MASNRQKLELLKEVRLRQARNNFLSYRKLINPKNKWGWWQEEVAEELQKFYDDMQAGLRPKLVIQAPPQHGKSVQIIDFISWLAGKNPDCRTIYTSFSERLGVRANLRLQRMYDSSIYKEIFPDTKINSSNAVSVSGQFLRNREIIEYVDQLGFFRNTTVKGSITGESLDLGVIDDPIRGRADANSLTTRNACWDWFTDDFFTRFSEDAGLLCILTRWHVDDPIGRLIERYPDIKVLSYEAIAEQDEKHRKAGEALFPEHKSIEFLNERKKIMPAANWAALYQQKPYLESGAVFKPEKIEVVDAIPAGVSEIVRGWDMAASANDGDYTAGVKIGKLPDGRYIILDVVRLQVGTDERDAAIKNTASLDGYGVKVNIPQDPGSAGKSQVAYLVKMLAGYTVLTSTESGDKIVRAGPMSSQINVGNVIMLRGAWNKDFIDEIRAFPNAKNDDQVDAASRAFNSIVSNNFGILDYMQNMVGNYE